MNTPLLFATQLGFLLLTIICYAFVLSGLKHSIAKTSWDESKKIKIFNRVLFSLLGWTLIISVLSLMGFYQDFSGMPPRFMMVLVVPLISILIAIFLKSTKEILQHVPIAHLVRLQVFRLFVEILLWLTFVQNLLPEQMTFEGRNFDVLTGLTALPAAYFLAKSRTGLLIWNVVTLGLLINVVSVAILSLPTPFRFFENELTIVVTFPFIWLPGLLVPLAYGLSFMSIKQALNTRA